MMNTARKYKSLTYQLGVNSLLFPRLAFSQGGLDCFWNPAPPPANINDTRTQQHSTKHSTNTFLTIDSHVAAHLDKSRYVQLRPVFGSSFMQVSFLDDVAFLHLGGAGAVCVAAAILDSRIEHFHYT